MAVPTFTTVMCYEGANFGVQVSENELQRMSSGDTTLIDEVMKRPSTRLVLMPDANGSNAPEAECQLHEYGDLNESSMAQSGSSSKETWTRSSTKLLLTLVGENYAELRNPRVKKRMFWDKMALLFREKGIKFNGYELQKKWNNTLDTYKKNKEKESRSGESSVRWEWYDLMAEFVDAEPKLVPQNMSFGSSMQDEDPASSDDHASTSDNDLPRSKKRRMRLTLSQDKCSKPAKSSVAVEMQRAREQKQQMFEELTRMEKERWKEEKAMRIASDQKKTDAVLLVAKAIQQLATAILKNAS